ncbi:hypothetical protein FO440_23635 [Mucilaginibacter corticis]|uniref:6-bladed beta-propeller n=1 Tax=Mucilaginibacter corticis TaxID=2597670 RepID=A0A556M7V5_9SPHI|nr:hypothetical protein [Mucilaginibacter corticis]TSJ35915.1 hypothetical protein FO440_23635 [Mucilaginibacter corticis]
MKPITYLLFLLCACLWSNGYAQRYAVSDFKQVPAPALSSKLFYALNASRYAFAVSMLHGRLRINQTRDSTIREYRVPEGKLIAIHLGEFGGGLFFKPNDTTIRQVYVNGKSQPMEPPFSPLRGAISANTHEYDELLRGTFLLKGGNVQRLFKFRDSLFMMEGLVFMEYSYGAVNYVGVKGDSVITREVQKLEDGPMAFSNYGDELYIATFRGLYRTRKWQKQLLLDKLTWGFFSPNSVAIKDLKHIYVGMNGGYVWVDAIRKKVTYFEYKLNKHY